MAPKYFSETLAGLAEGDLDQRATKLLAELADKVETTGGKGKLTLTLTISKMNRMAVIKPSLKATMPEPAVDDTMFFVGVDGELTRDDPKQLALPKVGGKGRVISLDGGKAADDKPASDKKPNDKDGN